MKMFLTYGCIEEYWGYGGYECLLQANSFFTENISEIIGSLSEIFKHKKGYLGGYSLIIWDEKTDVNKLTEALFSAENYIDTINLTDNSSYSPGKIYDMVKENVKQERLIEEEKQKKQAETLAKQQQETLRQQYEKLRVIFGDK